MKLLINFITCIVFCVLPVLSHAKDMMLTLKDLNDKSSDIIIGRVESINSFYINNVWDFRALFTL